MMLSRIRQEDEEEEARRRRHLIPKPTPPEALAIHPGHGGGGRRGGEHFCRCPSCEYELSVEEGQQCNQLECPRCGTRMRAVSIGEYRVSQAEAAPIAPLLFAAGFFGLLGYMIAKRPFG